MTIYKKDNAVGIDKEIADWQDLLDGCFHGPIDIYGRLYITEKNDTKKIAEAYITNGEYKEIFLDDTKNAVFGFLVEDIRNGFDLVKCKATLICSCNIDKIYGSETREDEQALLTVLHIIKNNSMRWEEDQIKTKMADVFNGISIDKFKFRDMHPWFNFSISFNLVYNINT